jgi:signal transduction histidine kinase
VWTNLFSNAVEAMAPGGTLTLRTRHARGRVWVKVSDTGSGISEADLVRMFDPFFTTKPMGEGMGMGLEIVKKIIAGHEGEITVRSEPGGTTFEVCLPVSD